jgi:glycosyltransferase involved in cell wall biosynthesis
MAHSIEGALIVTGQRQGPLLAPSIKAGLSALEHVLRQGRRLELVVVLAGADEATTDVAAEQLAGRGALVRLAGGGLGAARNAGVARASGQVLAIIEGGDLVDPAWLERAVEAVDRQPLAVVRAQYLLMFGPTFGEDDFLLRQSGMERPDFARHRLMFERLLYGPMALSKTLAERHPFDADMAEHMYGPDDWAWIRRTAMAGAEHVALNETMAAVRRRNGVDPLSAAGELSGFPTEPFI